MGQYFVTILYTKLFKRIVIQVVLLQSLITGMLFLTKWLKCFILAETLVLDLEVNIWNMAYWKQGNKSIQTSILRWKLKMHYFYDLTNTHYKVVFIGRKESVKGLSQRSTITVVTDTSSPCKIFTGHTHAKFQTTVGLLYLQVPHPWIQPTPDGKYSGRGEFCYRWCVLGR